MWTEELAVVRSIYEAMARREFPSVFELLDPAFVLTQDPMLPWGGWYEGHHGFAAFGVALGSVIDFSLETAAMFHANGEVVQFGRLRGRVLATGGPLDLPEVHRWTVRDGKAVVAHLTVDTPGMLKALRG